MTIMAESYKVSAEPLLYTEGDHKGRLNGVFFTATSGTEKITWFTVDRGHFEDVFTRVLSRGRARSLVASLMEGDNVELPDVYRKEQFDDHFAYGWKAPHFVRLRPAQQAEYSY